MTPVGVFIAAGILSILLSGGFWLSQPTRTTLKATGQPDWQAFTRSLLLALWTLALPLYLALSFQQPADPFALQVLQYKNKLLADVWAAIVLGLLVGVKKSWLTLH